MRMVWIIAMKDLLLAWRDRLGFFWWMLGFPLLIAVFIGAIFTHLVAGEPPRVRFALVDLADNPASHAYVDRLRQWTDLEPQRMDFDPAVAAMRQGGLAACLVIEPGFVLDADALAGKPLPVRLLVDAGGGMEEAVLRAALREAALMQLRADWLATVEAAPELIATAQQVEPGSLLAVPVERVAVHRTQPASSFEVCFPLGMIWGLIGLAAELAMTAVREHEEGTLRRMRAAPIAAWQIVAGRGLACFVSAMGVMALLLVVGRGVFGVRWQSPPALLLAVPATAICFVGISLFLSSLGRSEASVAGGAWAVLLVLAMLGGGMVPQMFMPAWMERVGQISPVRWAILALEGGIWRGFVWRDALQPAGVLLGQGMLFAALGTMLLRRQRIQ